MTDRSFSVYCDKLVLSVFTVFFDICLNRTNVHDLFTSKYNFMKSVRPFGVSFYIRQNKSARKSYSVYCCIRVYESSPKELCVASQVKRDDWDLRKGRSKQRSDHLIKLSLLLESIKALSDLTKFDMLCKFHFIF